MKIDKRVENEKLILRAAEKIFAEYGFKGATTKMIADEAGIPKANLHYYYPTKTDLYRTIVEHIFKTWLQAADGFELENDPVAALSFYIEQKMEISRKFPNSSKVWANEIMHGAPIVHDYLETNLAEWTKSREDAIQKWIDQGLMDPIDPKHLLYMIWATTQHYADFNHQINTLNNNQKLSDEQWQKACEDIKKIIISGVGAKTQPLHVKSMADEKQSRIQKKNREQILSAALEVFSNFGFRGSTIDQIAKQAQMSKPNILYYFENKEAIHTKLLESLLTTWLEPLEQINAEGDPLDEILSYIQRKLEMSKNYPRESRLFANEILQGAPRIEALIRGDLKKLVDDKVAIIQKWCDEGKLKQTDPHHLLFSIWATTQHYADFETQVVSLLGDSSNMRYQNGSVFLKKLYKNSLDVTF